MRPSINLAAALATAAAFVTVAALPASAECKRFGFSVNDYGKDGPTKDAKDLLDKLIASKMTEKGVKDYKTGTKAVSCELFLNFIVFDEHTCTAEATVCWGGSSLPNSEQAAATDGAATTKTSSEETPKASKKKKEAVAKASGPAQISDPKSAEIAPDATLAHDPKASTEHKSEAKQEAAKPAESDASAPSTATAVAAPEATPPAAPPAAAASEAAAAPASPAEAPAPAATASVTPPAAPTAPAATATAPAATAKKLVETGSLNETAKKPAKHKTEKAASGSTDAGPIMPKAKEDGYPMPVPPQDGAAQ